MPTYLLLRKPGHRSELRSERLHTGHTAPVDFGSPSSPELAQAIEPAKRRGWTTEIVTLDYEPTPEQIEKLLDNKPRHAEAHQKYPQAGRRGKATKPSQLQNEDNVLPDDDEGPLG